MVFSTAVRIATMATDEMATAARRPVHLSLYGAGMVASHLPSNVMMETAPLVTAARQCVRLKCVGTAPSTVPKSVMMAIHETWTAALPCALWKESILPVAAAMASATPEKPATMGIPNLAMGVRQCVQAKPAEMASVSAKNNAMTETPSAATAAPTAAS